MNFLLLVFTGAVFILFIFLCLPVTFAGRIHLTEKISGEGELVWAGGLIAVRLGTRNGKTDFSWRLGPFNSRPRSRDGRETSGKPREFRSAGKKKKYINTEPGRESSQPASSRWKSIALLADRRLAGRTVSFLGRLFRSLRLKLRLEGEYGTGDPALTGYLAAVLASLSSGPKNLSLRPNFTEAFLDLRGEFRGQAIPMELVLQAGSFLLTAPVRRIWWSGIIKPKLARR